MTQRFAVQGIPPGAGHGGKKVQWTRKDKRSAQRLAQHWRDQGYRNVRIIVVQTRS